MRAITAATVATLSAAILACGGDDDASTPSEGAPGAQNPLAAPFPAPAPVPVAAPVAVPADPTGAVKLTPDQIAAIQLAKGEYDAITTAANFKTAWLDAQKLGLDDTLTAAYEAKGVEFDVGWLLPVLPGVRVDTVAEGTMIQLNLDPDAWLQKAKITPEGSDDAFLKLLNDTHSAATTAGYAAWQERTWDYGGCSTFGRGGVLAALKGAATAAAAGDLFAPEIAEIHTQALNVVLVGDPGFQYCAPDGGPTADAALQGEAQQILDQVKLTDEEKAALTARIPLLHGEQFSGG